MRKRAKKPSPKARRQRVWVREALEAHRLIPPDEVEGQACWSCGRQPRKTMFGWQPRIVEINDAYGRVVLCLDCLTDHLSQLKQDQGPAYHPPAKRHLPTFEEWKQTATIEEVQAVIDRIKAKGGDKSG